jgi:hypothetical protein
MNLPKLKLLLDFLGTVEKHFVVIKMAIPGTYFFH